MQRAGVEERKTNGKKMNEECMHVQDLGLLSQALCISTTNITSVLVFLYVYVYAYVYAYVYVYVHISVRVYTTLCQPRT